MQRNDAARARRTARWAVAAAFAGAMFASTAASAAAYRLDGDDTQVVGAVTSVRVRYEDTLASVAQQHGLGYRELLDANPEVDPWIPGEGTEVVLPTAYVLPSAPREGVVINVAEYRLYYYPPDKDMVVTYPVGLGRDEFRTPLGSSRIVMAIENPSWTPTESSRQEHAAAGNPLPPVVPPGPENPLGSLALMLDLPGYFIHGTNQPFGVGQMVSHGCIRLYEPHIATLAELTRKGTPVHIVHEPYKVGWRGDSLFVEAHRGVYTDADPADLAQQVEAATKNRAAVIDWARVQEVAQSPTGVPSRI
ncbi:MAG: L,D-transpeptidase [Gammaproteobacteria bacterium]|nr:L,D-transpeptidase [Gammaproteobacteria bacterium]MBK80398.1 L,D-transpeptidase [Gammaproteobacteria bacterium]|tara:strand:- start:6796 stop:7713 length:918 start_codon:yes stop_codon:yes gene_type:complete